MCIHLTQLHLRDECIIFRGPRATFMFILYPCLTFCCMCLLMHISRRYYKYKVGWDPLPFYRLSKQGNANNPFPWFLSLCKSNRCILNTFFSMLKINLSFQNIFLSTPIYNLWITFVTVIQNVSGDKHSHKIVLRKHYVTMFKFRRYSYKYSWGTTINNISTTTDGHVKEKPRVMSGEILPSALDQ